MKTFGADACGRVCRFGLGLKFFKIQTNICQTLPVSWVFCNSFHRQIQYQLVNSWAFKQLISIRNTRFHF